ncbi:phage baseplate assembly protein V [Chromobacterium violaceum]|uniref:phage baseplate assembly protein V n=1 Tax=Chromobacterium violaceum TaxID=536 RepID=UPI00194E4682|nr:phage baseplate assembly protein V [Chromobacterium violaceum]QRO34137.1 phage baseplate assembly protein V [Chromobacterium violaceum]QRQ16060.1 phage baseplate assembly protein V [Chromobacterium violaceum]
MTVKAQAALLKFGTVASVTDAGHVCVQFPDLDGMISQPLKVVVPRASQDKAHHAPQVGAQVACVVDENIEDGVVLGETYNDQQVPVTGNPALWFWRMADGSEFEFNPVSGRLRVKTTSDVDVESASSITLKAADAITLDAPVVVLTEDARIGGGISQGGGKGGKASFAGQVESSVDVVAQGKSLVGHRHRENGPGAISEVPI